MKRFTRLLAVVLALALVFGTIPVSAASKSCTAKSQSALNEALNSGKYTKITIKTSEKVTFKIGDGKYTKITLYVTSPNATVENSGKFKKIVINDASVYTEKAVGNTIKVSNKKTTVNVAKGAEVTTLALAKKGAKNSVNVEGKVTTFKLSSANTTLNLVNNGTIKKLYLYKSGSIARISGTPDTKTSVITKKAAKNSTVESVSPIKLTIYADTDIVLDEGAEGSSVTAKEKDLNVSLKNTSGKKLTYTQADGKKVTVKAGESVSYGDAKTPTTAPTSTPVPTSTPTPTATPEPTATPTPEPKKLTIEQTASNVFTISGDPIKSTITESDVYLYTLVGSTKIPATGNIKSVSYAEGKAIVTMYTDLSSNTQYYIDIADTTISFTAASTTLADVAKVELVTTEATLYEEKQLEFRYYDKTGIELTNSVKSQISACNYDNPSIGALIITAKTGAEKVSLNGDKLVFTDEGVVVLDIVLVTSLDSSYNPIKTGFNGAVKATKPTVNGIIYTVTKDDGKYLTAKEKNNTNNVIYINDTVNISFEALIVMSDGTYKSLPELGYTAEQANGNIFMVTGTTSSGGAKLYANNKGESAVLIRDINGTVIQSCKITVMEAKKPAKLEVKTTKGTLNTNIAVDDSLIVTALVYDQYGKVMDAPTISVKQTDASITSTGTVSLGTFVNGKLEIAGADVTITGTAPAIGLEVSCGDLKQTVNFGVKNIPYSATETYKSQVKIDGDKNIDTCLSMTTQDNEPVDIYIEYSKDGFLVGKAAGTPLGAIPTASLKASDLGVAAGTTALYYVLRNGSKFYTSSTLNIKLASDCITLTPIATGSKLEAGNYEVRFYKITANDSNSVVTPLSTAVVTVTDSKPDFAYEKIQNEASASGSWADILPKFFIFRLDDEVIPATCIADAEIVTSTTGATVVKYVTFKFNNDAFGVYELKVELTNPAGNGKNIITIK